MNNCQSHETNVSSCNNRGSNNGFLIIVVLYILIAIILGSRNSVIY